MPPSDLPDRATLIAAAVTGLAGRSDYPSPKEIAEQALDIADAVEAEARRRKGRQEPGIEASAADRARELVKERT